MRTTIRLMTVAAAFLAIGTAAHAQGATTPGKSVPAAGTTPHVAATPTTDAVRTLPAPAAPAPAPGIARGEPHPDAHKRGPQEFLAKADKNGDGKVTREEFLAFHAERGAEFFARLDKNGDGAITPDEMVRPERRPETTPKTQ